MRLRVLDYVGIMGFRIMAFHDFGIKHTYDNIYLKLRRGTLLGKRNFCISLSIDDFILPLMGK
jgi:hypothetical protein